MDRSGEISLSDFCRLLIGEIRAMKFDEEDSYIIEGYVLAINGIEDRIVKAYKRETGYDLY